MSDPSQDWRRSSDDGHDPDASPGRRLPPILVCVALGSAVAVLGAAIWMVGLRPDRSSISQLESEHAVMATSVGPIIWTRIDGDTSSLPMSVSGAKAGRLVGGEGGRRGVWRSEDGLLWDRSTEVVDRQDAGGVSWVRRGSRETQQLFQATAIGETAVDLSAPADDGAEGFVVSSEIVGPDAGGIVWELDDQVFVLAVHAIRGTTTSQWLRWTGDGFVATDPPWTDDHIVEVAALDHGVLAAVTDTAARTVEFWRSTDGSSWQRSVLPEEPAVGTPLPSLSDDTEPVVTLYTDAGISFWTTADGDSFQPLPDIPGIARRSSGSPGWVAPDPRSSPRIRVSPDGITWEELDLREILGIDGSYWDLTIDARIIDSTIYVTATWPDHRTMLIGSVEPAT